MKQSNDNRCPTGAFRLVKLRQRDPATKLGFSLRGGKEATGSSVGVFVSHIEPNGQASQIGLRLGDQLIQVNGLQVSQATYDEVIELIKQTPKCDHICLLVNYVGRIPYQEKAGDPIGWLNVDADLDSNNQENYSPTDRREMSADYPIGETNRSLGDSPTNLTNSDSKHEQDVATFLSPRLDHGIELTGNGYQVGVAGTRNSSTSNQDKSYSSSSSAVSSCFSSQREGDEYDDDEGQEDDVVLSKVLVSSSSSSASTSSGCSISMSSVQSGHSSASSQTSETLTKLSKTTATDMRQDRDEVQANTPVRVPGGRRTSEPFGCGVVKGPDEWPGIFVQNVKRNSLAERVGLQPGDQLLEAEGHELTEMAFEEAINLIKRLQSQQDELLLLVRKGAALKHLAKCKQHHTNSSGCLAPSEALKQDNAAEEQQRGHNQAEDLRRAAPLPPTTPTTSSNNRPSEMQPAFGCKPTLRPTVRRKPLEAPPAPPTRRNQQANSLVASEQHQIGSDKLEQSKRLVNGQSVASSAPIASSAGGGGSRLANSISVRSTESATTKAKRQQVAGAQQPAAENKEKAEATTMTISEPTTRQPADRTASKRRPARAEEVDAAAQVAASDRSSLQRTPTMTGPVERSDELKVPKATPPVVHLERRNSNSPAKGSNDDDGPKAASAGRNKAASLDLESEFESDANQRASQLAGCDHNNSQQQQVDEKRVKLTGQQKLEANKMGQNSNYDHCDDELELEPGRYEHEEEIRIVKQNCKLHHSSAQSLVKSKMFLQQPVENDCKNSNHLASNQRDMSPRTDLTRPLASAKSSARRAPKGVPTSSSNQLQRHVSVDNLNLVSMCVANNALNYQTRPCNDEPICSGQLAANLRQHHHQELLLARPSRPSSVLSSATATAAPMSRVNSPLLCCSALNQNLNLRHHRRAWAQLRRHCNEDVELLSRQQQQQQSSSSSPQECCLMAAARQKQQLLLAATYRTAPPIGGQLSIRPTTMKHLRAISTSKGATGSAGKLLKQPTCNTLALAKFKARSEDRLNLMNINLNYAQISPKQPTMASSDMHLLKLKQARHQKQQARILDTTRRVDWPSGRPINQATDLVVPACCLVQQQQQAQLTNLIKQTQGAVPAPHQPVFNYATATGMISQPRKVSPLARSCCAIDRFSAIDQVETSDQTLALIARQNQKQHQQRKMKLLAPMSAAATTTSMAAACYAHGFCCCPREQELNSQVTATAKSITCGGGSTDSSGYQSSSENAARRQNQLNSNKLPLQTVDCCRPTTGTIPEVNGLNQTRRLSTFGSVAGQSRPTAATRAKSELQPKQPPQSPVIEIGSCGVSSISSVTATSSSSSLSPFSLSSPLSSPGQRYLSSSSSNSSHVDLVACTQTGTSELSSAMPSKSKTRLFKRRTNGAQLAGVGSEQNPKSIPRPPPMPLDDLTLRPARSRPEPKESDSVRSCQQPSQFSRQVASGSGATSKAPTKSSNSRQLSNKLCFVDELKMLANQQQKGNRSAHLQQLPNQGQGDSATLIKLINANKAAAGASNARRGPIGCSCCQAGDCSLGQQQQAADVSSCRKFGYATSKAAARNANGATSCSSSQPSKSVQLRDEENNKRRQHELLMDEFKTAHSKMFNKLRKVNGNNESRTITNEQQHDDDDDEDLLAERTGQHNDHSTETKPSAATNKTSNGNANLAVIRPRPTVATN